MSTEKLKALGFSAVVLLLVSAPVLENWKAVPKDNFPFSYYPMFNKKRAQHYTLYYMVGYDADNQRVPIPYRYISSGGFNQTRRQLIKTCQKGDPAQLAEKVAGRLKASNEPVYNSLQRVEVVRGVYDLDAYFSAAQRDPVEEELLAMQNLTTL